MKDLKPESPDSDDILIGRCRTAQPAINHSQKSDAISAEQDFRGITGMKVYLDNCCFNRPYDNQNQLSVKLETEAKLSIQEMIKDKKLFLIWSFMLDYENSANTGKSKKESIYEWYNYAQEHVPFQLAIFQLAQKNVLHGFGKKDSIHLACAVIGKCEYFITVDKGILNKSSKIKKIKILDPISFIRLLEEKS